MNRFTWMIFVAALLLDVRLSAQTAWTGATSTDWNTGSNWNPGTVPDGTADVVIDTHSGNMVVLSSGTTTIGGAQLFVGYNTFPSGVPSSVTVQSGAHLTSGVSWVAYNGSAGSVTVTGAGSVWNNSLLTLGYYYTVDPSAVGTLVISNGGRVNTNSGDGTVGEHAHATATVTGTGSLWSISNGLTVGDSNTGSLTVSAGAHVSTGSAVSIIGGGTFGNGTVTLTGAGSRWDAHNDVYVGASGGGTLTISSGATLNMINSGFGFIGAGFYSSGTSTVTVTGAGSTWNPFLLQIGGTDSTGTLTVSNGGAVTTTVAHIESSTDWAGVASASILGAGSTWTNTGANFTIGGAGTSGALTLGGGGRLVTKGLDLANTAQLAFQLGGTSATTDYGQVSFLSGGSATLAGELDVSLFNSFNPVSGATFDLFNYNGDAVSGTFNTINLPTLSGGETWDLSNLYTAGTIDVVGTAVPEPSTYAAIFGLFALGAAGVREMRRRRAVAA